MAIYIKPSHRGLLHRDTGTPMGKKIPAAKLKKAERSKSAKVRRRAVFAENQKKWHHGAGRKSVARQVMRGVG